MRLQPNLQEKPWSLTQYYWIPRVLLKCMNVTNIETDRSTGTHVAIASTVSAFKKKKQQ